MGIKMSPLEGILILCPFSRIIAGLLWDLESPHSVLSSNTRLGFCLMDHLALPNCFPGFCIFKMHSEPGVVGHAYHSSTREVTKGSDNIVIKSIVGSERDEADRTRESMPRVEVEKRKGTVTPF